VVIRVAVHDATCVLRISIIPNAPQAREGPYVIVRRA